MNAFDTSIIHFLNQFAQRSWFADTLMYNLASNELLKGGVIVSIFWWAWFRTSQTQERDRQIILAGIATSTLALFAARGLALLLPFRERPLRNPALDFHVPISMNDSTLQGWSSFPSDHAVLFFALATSIWLLSRRLGILAYCHALFVVCLPRIYLGVHYPTDILAGATLGIGFGLLPSIQRLRTLLSAQSMRWFEQSPAVFYPCFYLVTFLLGTNFDPLRTICHSAWHVTTLALHHQL